MGQRKVVSRHPTSAHPTNNRYFVKDETFMHRSNASIPSISCKDRFAPHYWGVDGEADECIMSPAPTIVHQHIKFDRIFHNGFNQSGLYTKKLCTTCYVYMASTFALHGIAVA